MVNTLLRSVQWERCPVGKASASWSGPTCIFRQRVADVVGIEFSRAPASNEAASVGMKAVLAGSIAFQAKTASALILTNLP